MLFCLLPGPKLSERPPAAQSRLETSAADAGREGGGDWISSLSGVTQEYCVTSIFSARALSGLRYCRVLYSRVQLVPSKNHPPFNPPRHWGGLWLAPSSFSLPSQGLKTAPSLRLCSLLSNHTAAVINHLRSGWTWSFEEGTN